MDLLPNIEVHYPKKTNGPMHSGLTGCRGRTILHDGISKKHTSWTWISQVYNLSWIFLDL